MTSTKSTSPSLPPSTLAEAGIVRQISFRGALLAKLNLIVWAYKSKVAAARMLKIPRSTLQRWYADETTALEYRNLVKVEELYAIAFEKRVLHEGRLAKRRARRRTQPDMNFSVDAI